MTASIRRQLTVGLLVATGLILAATAVTSLAWTRRVVARQFDANLEARARALCALVQQEPAGGLEVTPLDATLPEFGAVARPDYLEIWDGAGRTLLRSPSLGRSDIAPPDTSPAAVTFWDVRLPDGRDGRGVRVRVFAGLEQEAIDAAATRPSSPAGAPPTAPAPRGQIALALLQDYTPVRQVEQALLSALAAAAAVGGGGLLGVIPWLVRRGLASLRRLSDQAAAIDGGTLSRRFDDRGLPAELSPICGRLNDLLARLEAAFLRERRFTADVAHELRTPIAELRSLAEVALKWPGDADAARQAFADALAVAVQMEAVVATLLALARCTAGRVPVRAEAVDVAQLLRDAWRPIAPRAAERGLSVGLDIGGADDLHATADPALLRAMLENVLRNAADHCPAGGAVAVRARREVERGGGVVVVIRNTNDSLTAGDLGHVLEPFWRKDAARSADGHTGLGLALVATYADATGVGLDVRLPAPDAFEIALRIPSPATAARPGGATLIGGVA